MELQVSKSQVDRAGQVWRDWIDTADLGSSTDVRRALGVVDHYRACHQYPLQKATMGLRSSVRTAGSPRVTVSQRLKRYGTILDKLVREPRLRLSQMQDIGGCRAVLDDIATVQHAQRLLERRRGYVRTVDYIAHPKDTGYRGMHVILLYDERFIEVQLRTRVMHDWAIHVERYGGRLHTDLKSGEGPLEVVEFLQEVSRAMAIEELGGTVDQAMLDRISALRVKALPLLSTTGGGP